MTETRTLDGDGANPVTRRPRIALMGEFSAGKSTLANLLLGHAVSPVKVTATQLPPVLYSLGPERVLRIGISGDRTPINSEDLDGISHHDTQAVCISLEADVLEFCDVIDMPGTSDPNLPQEIWERTLEHADGVVWCTPCTQAWRQSEAALWESLPARLHENSLLLITRMDKLGDQSDRDRVLARVAREADGLFKAVLPISLTQALAAEDDPERLEACGAEQFVDSLVEIVETLDRGTLDPAPIAFGSVTRGGGAMTESPKPVVNPAEHGTVVPRRIVPKRVRRAASA